MDEISLGCSCGKHVTQKEHLKEWHKLYCEKNKQKIRQSKKLYYEKHRDVLKQKRLQYYKKNREINQLYMRKYSKNLRVKIRSIILWYFNYHCSKCGYNADSRALQLDHINGGGSQEQREIGPISAHYYRNPQELFEKFQLLCANCNYIKRHENDEF